MSDQRPDAVLILEDGTVFRGKAAAGKGTATGEICFNTGMTGYQEIFTDPSYTGQIVVMANVHVGNYGVMNDDAESDRIQISGMVCRSFAHHQSRPGAYTLKEYFENNDRIAISDVDTRALVRHIRDTGAMNCIISTETDNLDSLRAKLSDVPSMAGLELSSRVTCRAPYTMGDPSAPFRVALLDLGTKRNIIRCLNERGCHVKVFPMNTPLSEMLAFDPHGFMISNGPGDPGAMTDTINLVRDIIETGRPVFGICLGHQLISLSQGIRTFKMHHGHRGINHPIKNLITGRGEITSQNHGFNADMDDCKANPNVEVTHIHLNDGSVAGLRLRHRPVFCVQYHPESAPGPNDSRYLFDQFVGVMEKK